MPQNFIQGPNPHQQHAQIINGQSSFTQANPNGLLMSNNYQGNPRDISVNTSFQYEINSLNSVMQANLKQKQEYYIKLEQELYMIRNRLLSEKQQFEMHK